MKDHLGYEGHEHGRRQRRLAIEKDSGRQAVGEENEQCAGSHGNSPREVDGPPRSITIGRIMESGVLVIRQRRVKLVLKVGIGAKDQRGSRAGHLHRQCGQQVIQWRLARLLPHRAIPARLSLDREAALFDQPGDVGEMFEFVGTFHRWNCPDVEPAKQDEGRKDGHESQVLSPHWEGLYRWFPG